MLVVCEVGFGRFDLVSLGVFGFLVSGGLPNGSSGVGFGWFCSFRFNSVGVLGITLLVLFLLV